MCDIRGSQVKETAVRGGGVRRQESQELWWRRRAASWLVSSMPRLAMAKPPVRVEDIRRSTLCGKQGLIYATTRTGCYSSLCNMLAAVLCGPLPHSSLAPPLPHPRLIAQPHPCTASTMAEAKNASVAVHINSCGQ